MVEVDLVLDTEDKKEEEEREDWLSLYPLEAN